MEEKIKNGIFINEPRENAPDFILGSLSLHIETLAKFIAHCRKEGLISEKGYLYLDIKNSRAGKKYVDLPRRKGQGEAKKEDNLPF